MDWIGSGLSDGGGSGFFCFCGSFCQNYKFAAKQTKWLFFLWLDDPSKEIPKTKMGLSMAFGLPRRCQENG